MRKLSLILIGLSFTCFVFETQSQETKWDEKLAHHIIDSLILKKKPTQPLKATLLSAVFPGAGQVYNRQYYKLHVVYGAIGGMIYAIDYNTRNFKRFDEAYRARLAGLPTPEFHPSIPDLSLSNRRDEFRKNKELSYFGLGLAYLLNVADAFVSSHLTTFNIEDDLATAKLKFHETNQLTGLPYPSLGIVISF